MFGILICAAVCGLAVSQPIPILNTDPGVRYNPSSLGAPIRFDVMLETNCPDSFAAWPELKLAAEFYGPTVLDLVIYQFQLPYHRWGHMSTQGFFAVQNSLGDSAALVYMEHVLDNYNDFHPATTMNRTHNEMLGVLSAHAFTATGVDPVDFEAEIDNVGGKTVFNWKLGTTRGVSGTPWYYLNGVDLGINYALTLAELQALIDPLLPV